MGLARPGAFFGRVMVGKFEIHLRSSIWVQLQGWETSTMDSDAKGKSVYLTSYAATLEAAKEKMEKAKRELQPGILRRAKIEHIVFDEAYL